MKPTFYYLLLLVLSGLFALPAKALTVIQPNGGETYTTGAIMEITWNKNGVGSNISIELTNTNNVVQWVIVDPTVNDGIYYWTIPNEITSGTYKIKIYETGTGAGVDYSDAVFTITSPDLNCSDNAVIDIIEPSTNLWTSGEVFNISWTGSLQESDCSVVIAYQVDDGPWIAVINFTEDDGNYNWTIPSNINSTNVNLSIIYTTFTSTGGAVGDILNGLSIQSTSCSNGATILITEPDPGEVLISGTTFPIRWTGSLKDNTCPVVIAYQVDEGAINIITSSTPDDGFYPWLVPAGINSINVDLVVAYTSRNANGNSVGNSVNNFTIQPSNTNYTIVQPNGSENYNAGTILPITWEDLNTGGLVSIELTNEHNITQFIIADPINNDGSYNWSIPTTLATGNYKIKLYQTGTGARVDYSDAVFSIVNSTTYLVNSSADHQDKTIGDGVCEDAYGNCTLRAAIQEANNAAYKDEIQFVDSIANITLLTNLPTLTQALVINGGTTGEVILNGQSTTDGLVIATSDVQLYGLHFKHFHEAVFVGGNNNNIAIGKANQGCVFTENRHSIFLAGTLSDLTFQGNYIGTDSNFNTNIGNEYGIEVSGKTGTIISNVLFGGDFNSPESNVVVNNTNVGVSFTNTQNAVITGNYFGTDKLGAKNLGNNFSIILSNGTIGGSDAKKNILAFSKRGIQTTGADLDISFNEIYENDLAINVSKGKSRISRNILTCNNSLIFGDNNDEPTITNVNVSEIIGITTPFNTVEVYFSDRMECINTPCQGNQFLGSTSADANGIWKLANTYNLQLNDALVAISIDANNHSSHVSSCFFVLPDDCVLAQPLPMNKAACSSVGTVLDLKQMTSSLPVPNTTCATTFVGNDAWFSVTIPPSGNFLLRTNINNTVNPVIEIYTNCTNLALPECKILDTIPFLMLFEDYTPNTTLYLRVWDKNNTIVDSDASALLHLTAHELGDAKKDWEICDYEQLISTNPTNLIRRDATTFILDYAPNTPESEVLENNAALLDEGLELRKECFCGGQAIQLWATDNPIILEDRRRQARKKACVDTTNYNYIFESIEFQVNSYAIGQQHNPRIAMNENGNFVMVWKDEQRRHNYGRVYKNSGNPISVEFQIGSSEKTQYDTDLTMNNAGDFIAVWHEVDPTQEHSSFSIFGRRFHQDGTKNGSIFNISQASYANSFKDELPKFGINAKVAMTESGKFIVIWRVDKRVFAQRYDETANRVGSIIAVSQNDNSSIGEQLAFSIREDETFIIAWTDTIGIKQDIYAQQFSSTGNKIGAVITVNNHTTNNQANPDLAINEDGSFILVWESYNQFSVNSDYDIYAQRFLENGTKIGNAFLVNSYTSNAQRRPSIATFRDGSFLITWSSFGQDGYAEGIYAKLFDSSGQPITPSFDDSDKGSVGEEFRLNVYNDPQQDRPQATTNGTSLFCVNWQDGKNDGSFEGIFAQRYELITVQGQKTFYSIGTATPSELLGKQLSYTTAAYSPNEAIRKATVAIIDTGTDEAHELIQQAIWYNSEQNDEDNCLLEDEIGYDFVNRNGLPIDIDGHGIQVNSMIAREFDPSIQLELMNLKFHELDKGNVFDAICGIYYAVDNGANIINLSWGFEASEEPVILRKALEYAASKDVLIITSAGNTSKNNDQINKYPANLDIPNMIVVTAYEVDRETDEINLANYASYGLNTVDIAAYGFVEAAQLGGGKTPIAGTSLAAPAVARTAAIIKGLYPVLTAQEIKKCILDSAKKVADLTDKVISGGILDHPAALECAEEKSAIITSIACATSDLTVDPTVRQASCNGEDGRINLSIGGSDLTPTFLWSTGVTIGTIENLTLGTYQVSVTDQNRCTKTLVVEVTENCNPIVCLSDVIKNEQPIPSNTYHSTNTIESAGLVLIADTVHFKAGQSITLKSGFYAHKGSFFNATIENCEVAYQPEESNPISNNIQSILTVNLDTINKSKINDVNVFPNPANNKLTVTVNHTRVPMQLEVISLTGDSFLSTLLLESQTQLDVSNLPPGLYFITVDRQTVEKVVIH